MSFGTLTRGLRLHGALAGLGRRTRRRASRLTATGEADGVDVPRPSSTSAPAGLAPGADQDDEERQQQAPQSEQVLGVRMVPPSPSVAVTWCHEGRWSRIRDCAGRRPLAGPARTWLHESCLRRVPPVAVGVGPLSFEEVVAVARDGAPVRLTDEARAAIEQARAVVDELAAAPTPAYGISTGFGALATRHIPTEMRAQLQRSLVRSHAAGSGPEVEREVVRGLMLLRLSTLATGRTGVRPELAELMAGCPQRGHHAGGARVRLARLLRRPRAALALRAGADRRGRGARRRRRADARGRRRSRPPASPRSSSSPRRAWR